MIPHNHDDVSYQWNTANDIQVLDQFSAVCWYFAQSLYDIRYDG